MSKSMKKLLWFMPPEELREYLKKESISDWDMADIIFYSLNSVEKKRETIYDDDIDLDEWMHGIFSSYAATKRYEPDLSNPEDAILAKVSELVAGDEERGTVIWDETCYGISEEEILDFLAKLRL